MLMLLLTVLLYFFNSHSCLVVYHVDLMSFQVRLREELPLRWTKPYESVYYSCQRVIVPCGMYKIPHCLVNVSCMCVCVCMCVYSLDFVPC